MSEPVVLRPARRDDAEAIARVHVETWRSTYAGLVPTDYLVGMNLDRSARQWRHAAATAGRGNHLLVLEIDKAVVGFVCCGPTRDRGMPYRGEVYALYLADDWQGRGLGRRLFGAGLAALAGDGHTGAVVWVLAENPTRFFYEAMGGKRVSDRVEKFAGAELDEMAYAWPDLAEWLSRGG